MSDGTDEKCAIERNRVVKIVREAGKPSHWKMCLKSTPRSSRAGSSSGRKNLQILERFSNMAPALMLLLWAILFLCVRRQVRTHHLFSIWLNRSSRNSLGSPTANRKKKEQQLEGKFLRALI